MGAQIYAPLFIFFFPNMCNLVFILDCKSINK